MKTIQMTLDEELVASVDNLVRRLRATRSAFARKALREALEKHRIGELERKHRRGYEIHPVGKTEFSVWEKEQDWGDE